MSEVPAEDYAAPDDVVEDPAPDDVPEPGESDTQDPDAGPATPETAQ